MARILVVHHDPILLIFFKTLLTRQGCKAVCASDYATAVDAVQQTRIQLVFLGGPLTGITGMDLAHTLRTLDPTLPLVVLVSLFDLHRGRLDALNVKSLIRPFSANKIIRTVRMHIRPDVDAQV